MISARSKQKECFIAQPALPSVYSATQTAQFRTFVPVGRPLVGLTHQLPAETKPRAQRAGPTRGTGSYTPPSHSDMRLSSSRAVQAVALFLFLAFRKREITGSSACITNMAFIAVVAVIVLNCARINESEVVVLFCFFF